jgi:hypothetical protein
LAKAVIPVSAILNYDESVIRSLRDEALLLLDGKGALLDVAREVTQLMRDADLHAPVIGGVAVVLHGYVRTTADIDLFTDDPPRTADILKASGFRFRKTQREFVRDELPIHLVTVQDTKFTPQFLVLKEGVEAVSLPDLINMKLRSGLANPLRAIDLADVIGLIRVRGLATAFASQLQKELRPDFRKLARAVKRESGR